MKKKPRTEYTKTKQNDTHRMIDKKNNLVSQRVRRPMAAMCNTVQIWYANLNHRPKWVLNLLIIWLHAAPFPSSVYQFNMRRVANEKKNTHSDIEMPEPFFIQYKMHRFLYSAFRFVSFHLIWMVGGRRRR